MVRVERACIDESFGQVTLGSLADVILRHKLVCVPTFYVKQVAAVVVDHRKASQACGDIVVRGVGERVAEVVRSDKGASGPGHALFEHRVAKDDTGVSSRVEYRGKPPFHERDVVAAGQLLQRERLFEVADADRSNTGEFLDSTVHVLELRVSPAKSYCALKNRYSYAVPEK